MRRSIQDWFDAGLRTLAKFGLTGLTIETLTADLGVTKGSFYHHFRNVEDFQKGLITYWGDQYLSTASIMPDTPDELISLLDTIMEEGFGAITGPEMTIRVWAQQDAVVRSVVEQVDSVRQEFVFTVFRSLVESDQAARLMTDVFSSMLVGSMMVLPRIPADRVTQLYLEFKRLYGL
jgi:AcrR family transcriptional regulator